MLFGAVLIFASVDPVENLAIKHAQQGGNSLQSGLTQSIIPSKVAGSIYEQLTGLENQAPNIQNGCIQSNFHLQGRQAAMHIHRSSSRKHESPQTSRVLRPTADMAEAVEAAVLLLPSCVFAKICCHISKLEIDVGKYWTRWRENELFS